MLQQSVGEVAIALLLLQLCLDHVGMGRFALNKATEYVKTRQVWKTPIGAHQGISHPLAQNHIEIELAKLLPGPVLNSTIWAPTALNPVMDSGENAGPSII